jgi:GNAT superfamily N-acetyltransferase
MVEIMNISISHVSHHAIQHHREQFLKELNRQFVRNSFHERGRADVCELKVNDISVGYGSVCALETTVRDSVFEFYLVPTARERKRDLFGAFLKHTRSQSISCQSNDALLASLLNEFGQNITHEAILFEEGTSSTLTLDGYAFRKRNDDDKIFEHFVEPIGDYVLAHDNRVVATGGFLIHYNFPFADLFMEVDEPFRRKGLASYLLQEIKKECYQAGRVPAARCNVSNEASRRSLINAGMKECGYLMRGEKLAF